MAYDHRQFFILSVYHFDDLRPEVAWRVNFIIDDVIDCFSPVVWLASNRGRLDGNCSRRRTLS